MHACTLPFSGTMFSTCARTHARSQVYTCTHMRFWHAHLTLHQAEHTHRHQTAVFRSGETRPEAGSKRVLPSDKLGPFPQNRAPGEQRASPRRRSRTSNLTFGSSILARWTSKRCTTTAFAGFPGAQVQRSCPFAPGNAGLGCRCTPAERDDGCRQLGHSGPSGSGG